MRQPRAKLFGILCFLVVVANYAPASGQNALAVAAPSTPVDENLIAKIHETAERLLGSNRFSVTSAETTTASDQSTVIEGASTFSGRADTYFKAVFNQAGKINYFYAGAPASGAFDPYGLTETFVKDPSYASLYLPNALRRRLAFDSYAATIDNATPTVKEVTV